MEIGSKQAMETITYSYADNLEIQLDLYLPPELDQTFVPALVHFHSGGMIAGCRKTLIFQQWLKGLVLAQMIIKR